MMKTVADAEKRSRARTSVTSYPASINSNLGIKNQDIKNEK